MLPGMWGLNWACQVLVGPEERTAEGPDAVGRGNSRQSGARDSGNRQ